jgi:hypothetical protein
MVIARHQLEVIGLASNPSLYAHRSAARERSGLRAFRSRYWPDSADFGDVFEVHRRYHSYADKANTKCGIPVWKFDGGV